MPLLSHSRGNGNSVLALGPHTSGGLDIDQHARNFRAALQLWQNGQLTPLGQPDDTWVAMSGSFGSLILFKALADLPEPPTAIVDVGGISDAFLGIQALYDADLAIPPPYDSAVAALGRPDRVSGLLLRFLAGLQRRQAAPDIRDPHDQRRGHPLQPGRGTGSGPDRSRRATRTATLRRHDALPGRVQPHPGTRLVYERVLQYVADAAQVAP